MAKTSLRTILPWAQRVLFAVAIVTLGYCAFVLVDTRIFQHREKQKLESLIHTVRPVAFESSPSIGPDGLIGRIEIPRLGLSAVVIEGTEKSMLRRAVGHIVSTALPGKPGNIGLAAHRDTFFRPLEKILHNDVITLTTVRGDYSYRVVATRVVKPTDVWVLNPDGNEILTLVTCYPFYFVGPAPSRFIVRAERVVTPSTE